MFVSDTQDLSLGEKVSVIGKVSKMETPLVYIKTNKSEIPVKFIGLHSYTKDHLCISGTVEELDNNLVIKEESINTLNDEFDMNLFDEFLTAAKNHPEMF